MNINTIECTNMLLFNLLHKLNNNIVSFSYKDIDIKIYSPYYASSYATRCIVQNNTFYELSLLQKIVKYVDSPKIILDIGANIGNHSIFFKKILNCQNVIGFEPLKNMIDVYKTNMQLNNITNYTLYNIALSDKNINVDIDNFVNTNYGETIFKHSENGKFEAKTLDSLNILDISLIKIDTEGHEYNVLRGAENTIKTQKPLIWVEMWENAQNSVFYKADNYQNVNLYLKNIGYNMVEKLGPCNYLYKINV